MSKSDKQIISEIRRYIRKYKTVDLKYYLKANDYIKNDREIDMIYYGVLSSFWYSDYKGHNPNDISLRLNPLRWAVIIAITGSVCAFISLMIKLIN